MTGRPAGDWTETYGDCLRCGQQMETNGVEKFRVGGTGGAAKLFFGEFAELGEGMIAFEILSCPTCGMVELRVPHEK